MKRESYVCWGWFNRFESLRWKKWRKRTRKKCKELREKKMKNLEIVNVFFILKNFLFLWKSHANILFTKNINSFCHLFSLITANWQKLPVYLLICMIRAIRGYFRVFAVGKILDADAERNYTTMATKRSLKESINYFHRFLPNSQFD